MEPLRLSTCFDIPSRQFLVNATTRPLGGTIHVDSTPTLATHGCDLTPCYWPMPVLQKVVREDPAFKDLLCRALMETAAATCESWAVEQVADSTASDSLVFPRIIQIRWIDPCSCSRIEMSRLEALQVTLTREAFSEIVQEMFRNELSIYVTSIEHGMTRQRLQSQAQVRSDGMLVKLRQLLGYVHFGDLFSIAYS